MATYYSLSPTEKSQLNTYVNFLRSLFVMLRGLRNQVDADAMNQFATNSVDGILAGLNSDEIVPNDTNLANATDLTVQQILTLQAIVRGLETTSTNNLSLIIQAIGVNV